MVTIRDNSFNIVQRSKNLRGILERTRRIAVDRVDVWPDKAGDTAQLGVTWVDGSSCVTDFASFKLCKQWCRARRAFPHAKVHEHAQS
jgi:hypothetical protein